MPTIFALNMDLNKSVHKIITIMTSKQTLFMAKIVILKSNRDARMRQKYLQYLTNTSVPVKTTSKSK